MTGTATNRFAIEVRPGARAPEGFFCPSDWSGSTGEEGGSGVSLTNLDNTGEPHAERAHRVGIGKRQDENRRSASTRSRKRLEHEKPVTDAMT